MHLSSNSVIEIKLIEFIEMNKNVFWEQRLIDAPKKTLLQTNSK